jgi:predicted nuclease with TOPRIM domain
MKNQRINNNSNIQSDNLKYKIDNFKSKFYSKSEYFICEHDIIGIMIDKYLNNMLNFSISSLKQIKNLIIKIYNSIIKKLDENNKLLVKFESLEKKLDNQENILKINFDLSLKLQKEVDHLKNNIDRNFETAQSNLDNIQSETIGHNSGNIQPETVEHNSNTKIDFYQEENLRLGSELVETKKKFEILKSEIEKYESQRSNLISKINSVNDEINNSNVLTNVFENGIKPKINIVDHKNISKKDEITLNDKVKAIFSNKL